MTRYLISFPGDAMDHIPDEDEREVARAAHAVIQEAKDAGVYLFAGGLDEDVEPVMVVGDGTVTAGTYPQTKELWGGVTIVDVPTREDRMAQWWLVYLLPPRRTLLPGVMAGSSPRVMIASHPGICHLTGGHCACLVLPQARGKPDRFPRDRCHRRRASRAVLGCSAGLADREPR
jgi:hypothetical protein